MLIRAILQNNKIIMQTYLVGGAVRDKLLNLKQKDKDFVVVGSNSQEMLDLGYQQVGKDFPVFLHPQTKQEYALARIERKNGVGYTGFEFDTKNVSLKEDLSRRDLTINSMAMSNDGELIDYFGGEEDLQNGLLKHTSSAFIEDPVRVLRIAKFRARFDEFGFKVAHSTFKLLKKMVKDGEVDNLVSERIFTELSEVLTYKKPSGFFKTLATCGAYEKIFGLKVSGETHSNNFEFLDNLDLNAEINTEINPEIKFAIWLQNYTQVEIKSLCKKIKAPKKYSEIAIFSKGFLDIAKHFNTLNSVEKLEFFSKTDSVRRVERFNKILQVFEFFNIDTKAIKNINSKLQNIDASKLDKKNIAQEIKNARLKICKIS
jgi:tRNA nucleotidyltransferase (CCA-adding enzyme)